MSLESNWTGASGFRAAGYEKVATNDTYEGGIVRQHGRLSFTRVFQAGHDTSWFQPQTVYEVIDRALNNKDIATGKISTSGAGEDYSSTGPGSSFGTKEVLPAMPPIMCYIWNAALTCTDDQIGALEAGTAVIVDGVVVSPTS